MKEIGRCIKMFGIYFRFRKPRCVEWRQTWKMRVITKNFSADKPTWDFGSYVT